MTTILRLTPVFHALVVALLLGLYFPAPATAAEDKAVYAVQVDGLACPFCAYGIDDQGGGDHRDGHRRTGEGRARRRRGVALEQVPEELGALRRQRRHHDEIGCNAG